MDYFKKYITYKTKYLQLKKQLGGARTYIDELSYETKNIIVTTQLVDLGWDYYDQFVTQVNTFNIHIIPITLNTGDWAQDFIKLISIDDNIIFDIHINTTTSMDSQKNIKAALQIYNKPQINILASTVNSTESVNNYNLQKGGNYIVLPNNAMLKSEAQIDRPVIKKIITMVEKNDLSKSMCRFSDKICLQIYLPDFNINTYYGVRVFHLDEILCLIPTGLEKDDYEIWFYDPICDDKEYQSKLKQIQEYNKTILHKYFDEDKIKYFPLKFSTEGHIIAPPLFNRVIMRKNNRFKIIFPEQPPEIKELINSRLEEIRRVFPDIIYEYINTLELHRSSGNIHCGFKTIPEI